MARLLEAQQKRFLQIILDTKYRTYGHILALTQLPRLGLPKENLDVLPFEQNVTFCKIFTPFWAVLEQN